MVALTTRLLGYQRSQGQADDSEIQQLLDQMEGGERRDAERFFGQTPPTKEQLTNELARLETLFGVRNSVIESNRRLVYQQDELAMRRTGSDRKASEVRPWEAALSIPEALLRRFKSRMSQAEPQIEISSYQMSKSGERQADRVEALLRRFASQQDKYFRASGGQDSFRSVMLEHLFVTGQVYEAVLVDERCKPIPLRAEIWDPLTVYPVWGLHGIARCYRKVDLRVEDVRRAYGDDCCADRDMDDVVAVVEFYSDEWRAVMVEGELVRRPEPNILGICPVVATFVHGRHGSLSRTRSGGDEIEANRSRGALQHLRNTFENLASEYEKALTVSEKAANPGGVAKRSETMPMASIPGAMPAAGEIVAIPHDGELKADYPQGMPVLQQMLAQLLGEIREATGYNIEQTDSGYAYNSVNIQQENSFFGPYMEATDSHGARESELVLQLYRACGCEAPVTDLSSQGKGVLVEMTPDLVPEDVEVEYRLIRITAVQRLMNAQQVVNLVGKLFGPRTGLEWVGEPNPDVVLQGLDEWMAGQNPAVLQAMTPIQQFEKALQSAQDRQTRGMPEAAQLYQAMAEMTAVQFMMSLQQAMQAASGGQNPQPQQQQQGPPGVPGGPQLEAMVMQLSQQTGLPPEQILAMMMQQGGGPGGLPPPDSLPPPEIMPPSASAPSSGDAVLQEFMRAGQMPAY